MAHFKKDRVLKLFVQKFTSGNSHGTAQRYSYYIQSFAT